MLTNKRFMTAAAAALVCASGSIALAAPQADEGKMGMGVGVICNTTEQAQSYVKLRSGGAEVTLAVSAVNERVQDPQACGVAAVAFERGKTVGTMSQKGRLVSIVQVRIVAGFDGTKWARVPDTVQYAIIENEGVEV